MNGKLTITNIGDIVVLNTCSGGLTSIYSSTNPMVCEKCNKQKFWAGTLPISQFFCNCNQPANKSDLEILQDEVKSLSKKVNELIKTLNK
jgi:hypothetical protein